MPVKKIDRQEILDAGLQTIRKNGIDKLNARSLSSAIGFSVQPIYSYFENMVQFKEELYCRALKFYTEYILDYTHSNHLMLSMSEANIAFARTETHLFRFLFLDRINGVNSFEDIFQKMADKEAVDELLKTLNRPIEEIKDIYLMMIIFTHGIATMVATAQIKPSSEEISSMVAKAYQSFINRK